MDGQLNKTKTERKGIEERRKGEQIKEKEGHEGGVKRVRCNRRGERCRREESGKGKGKGEGKRDN